MKKVPILALVLASFMLLTVVGPAFADTTATEAPAAEAAVAPEANALYGQVTKVDGNAITIALATLPEVAVDTTATETPATDAAATEAPAADAAATEAPAADAAAPALALTGETATFTVDDATVITLKAADGTDATGALTDIAVGSVVTVELTDNMATTITVEAAPATDAATADATATDATTDATATEAPASNG